MCFICWPRAVVAVCCHTNSGTLAECSSSLFLAYRYPSISSCSDSVTVRENMQLCKSPWHLRGLPKLCILMHKKVSGSTTLAMQHFVGSQTYKGAFLVDYFVMWTIFLFIGPMAKLLVPGKYVNHLHCADCVSLSNWYSTLNNTPKPTQSL